MKKVELRAPLRRFAEEMERKLKANDHKGGWLGCSFKYLFDRMSAERRELHIVVDKCLEEQDPKVRNDLRRKAIEEAADVANFAMFIADKMRENRL